LSSLIRNRFVLLTATMGLCALTALTGCRKGAPADAPAAEVKKMDPVAVEVATAELANLDVTVPAQGILAAAQGASARVAVVTPARLLEVRVREGDRVQAGQVVAVVDSRQQQAQALSASAAVTASQSQARQADLAVSALETDQNNAVRLAQLSLTAAQQDRVSSVQLAKNALEAAQTDLQKTKAGARPQELAQADQAVNQATATRDRAQTELQRVQFLFDKGVSARRALDDAKTALTVANAGLETARQQASLLRAGARPEDLRAGELRVDQAKASLAQAETSGRAKIDQARAALRQAQGAGLQIGVKKQEAQAMHQTAAAKQADLSAAQAVAGYATLHAPLSGIVTRRALNPGDMADPATPILEIANNSSLNLLANLPAEQGVGVRAGMPVRVTAADYPGRTFSGKVISVGQVDPLTNLMAVRIAVSNPGGILKAGSFATADIILRSQPHTLVVPKQAVVTRDGKTVVFTVEGDAAHMKEVTVGSEQGDRVEITQGLKPGEKVIRLGQYSLEDGAKVQFPDAKPAVADNAVPKAGAAK
jgi:HlyD family secretion protein